MGTPFRQRASATNLLPQRQTHEPMRIGNHPETVVRTRAHCPAATPFAARRGGRTVRPVQPRNAATMGGDTGVVVTTPMRRSSRQWVLDITQPKHTLARRRQAGTCTSACTCTCACAGGGTSAIEAQAFDVCGMLGGVQHACVVVEAVLLSAQLLPLSEELRHVADVQLQEARLQRGKQRDSDTEQQLPPLPMPHTPHHMPSFICDCNKEPQNRPYLCEEQLPHPCQRGKGQRDGHEREQPLSREHLEAEPDVLEVPPQSW